ncbi:protein ALP1-like [Coccinella septempunctata]|uniref:protein ALP1-like n=1 Tax=Coccinella septempunctata TaxID=41139 RepID=UPI001D08E7BF|nr:protein ALP1-like [Coccinella septempunctata]XP_044760282.1 protein ALP1-like [Coccinella septempunctata]
MSQFSRKELCAIALLLDEEEEEQKSMKRFGVHPIFKKRKIEGEFWTLYKELVDDDAKYHGYFRMNRSQFEYILNKISTLIRKKNTTFKEAVSPKEKLAVCLRFLATGDSFKTISYSYRLGHSTVQSIVKDVSNAIITTMKSEHLPLPTVERWNEIAQDFWEIWNFPNCIGAIDGKHVQIIAPANSGSLYFNYKKTFSVNLMALVDAKYQFIAVDIGSYGKNSDGGIFHNSNLKKFLENKALPNIEDKPLPGMTEKMPHVIVGDEAFPLKPYLLRPYPGAQCNEIEKQQFNYRLSRARRVVENAFGLLSQRFRLYNRRIQLQPDFVDKIIMTTCILHNFIGPHSGLPSEDKNEIKLTSISRQGGNNSLQAFNVRNTFKEFFQSGPGRLEWQ